MYSTICTNSHHDVTTFEVEGMVSNKKAQYLKNGT